MYNMKQGKVAMKDSGVGLDCGTMNFVSARKKDKDLVFSKIRDAFLDLPKTYERMLKISSTASIEMDDQLYVVGDQAMEIANILNREARRPLSGGLVSSSEYDAQRIISILMDKVLGKPKVEKEKCFYSVPAPALDIARSDVSYHSMILGKILSELGYDPEPMNESLAIVYTDCVASRFSGLAFSYGSGMTNVCLAYNAVPALEFSLARGGDWVDSSAATAINSTSARVCALKEAGVDIMNPNNRDEEAIACFLRGLVGYTLAGVIKHFKNVRNEIMVPEPIPIIVSGGTSMATNFVKLFESEFAKVRDKFPIKISEIRHSSSPLNSVAAGLYAASQML